MRISGFSFVRDAVRLHYPIAEAVRSALPLVDEFVVAVGPSKDGTVETIRGIGDPRIRIIETSWDPAHFVHGRINAVQTDIAMDACSGDWGIYLQADEVLHEDDVSLLRSAMERWRDEEEVEGFLFNYLHFWGDFGTVQWTRNWYRHEVRIVRLGRGIHSWKSAQGFRREGRKLRVRASDARIFHYGWVRPPEVMKRKQIALDRLHHDEEWVRRRHPEGEDLPFDYGTMRHLRSFRGTHPEVMRDWIAAKAWRAEESPRSGGALEHEQAKTRFLTWLEDRVLHRQFGVYRNYIRIGKA
jgi:glycosyltransferase involved in cell wall biosynthesis